MVPRHIAGMRKWYAARKPDSTAPSATKLDPQESDLQTTARWPRSAPRTTAARAAAPSIAAATAGMQSMLALVRLHIRRITSHQVFLPFICRPPELRLRPTAAICLAALQLAPGGQASRLHTAEHVSLARRLRTTKVVGWNNQISESESKLHSDCRHRHCVHTVDMQNNLYAAYAEVPPGHCHEMIHDVPMTRSKLLWQQTAFCAMLPGRMSSVLLLQGRSWPPQLTAPLLHSMLFTS